MMREGVLVIAGCALQLTALTALLHGDGATHATGALLAYLGIQALAAALLAMPLQRLLSRHVRTLRRAALAYLFAAGALVPLGGLLVALLGMALARFRHRTHAMGGIASVALPEFVSSAGGGRSQWAGRRR
ncbi:hypothetical protein OJJOAM_004287 [Cupriavidus sp. H18C1]|uniref:hypothetical protein n=1 Tax=Cupriavidus sp. H18C1 TaxID=3241601 RepID=UPI003BB8D8B6